MEDRVRAAVRYPPGGTALRFVRRRRGSQGRRSCLAPTLGCGRIAVGEGSNIMGSRFRGWCHPPISPLQGSGFLLFPDPGRRCRLPWACLGQPVGLGEIMRCVDPGLRYHLPWACFGQPLGLGETMRGDDPGRRYRLPWACLGQPLGLGETMRGDDPGRRYRLPWACLGQPVGLGETIRGDDP